MYFRVSFVFVLFNPFSIAITSLREERELILMLFVRLFDLSLFRFVGFCSMFFVSKGNLFDVYFTTLQLVLVPCGGGRTSPRTLPYCRLYFVSFRIIGPIVESLKMEFCSCIR